MRLAISFRIGLALALTALAASSRADVWDLGTPNDNDSQTRNELSHGTDQVHDLGPLPGPLPDTDTYTIAQPPYSSWEVLVDVTSPNTNFGVYLVRTPAVPVTIQQSVGTSTLGHTRSLRWQNTTSSPVTTEYIRVYANNCETPCTASDTYRLRALETTLAVPRFNNIGQSTVLVVQNTSSAPVGGTIYFWTAAGTLITTAPLAVPSQSNIPGKQLLVLSLPGIAALAGQSGSITISHDGRYGDLSGKTVTLEPATGYTFDTLMVGR